jgi:hypothetical protein
MAQHHPPSHRQTALSSKAPTPVLQRCSGVRCPPGVCRHHSGEAAPRNDGTRHGLGGTAPAVAREVLRSPGRPLDEVTQASMSRAFEHDFSRVRIHTDELASDSARAVDARAFAVGSHVVFSDGAYSPHTEAGRRLLAHELTHVVQQHETRHALLQRQPVGAPVEDVDPRTDESGPYAAQLGQAGLIALAQLLEGGLADEAELLRRVYNEGAVRIAAEQVRLNAEVASGRMTRAQMAEKLSDMRHRLAVEVRRAGSALNRQFAELYDRVRGNAARPTYDSLRLRGKSDFDIIRSASKTDEFVNRLPGRMRWAGRGLWFVSGGISIYVVIDAPPDQREAVVQDELEGLIGGAAGAGAGAGVCVATGVATGGLGLIVCGLLGGMLGATAAREFDLLRLLDIAPHAVPGRAGSFYVIEGEWDVTDLFIVGWVNRRVSRAERVVVVSTGRVSGQQMSGRYGHYRSEEVVPANDAAVALFGGTAARWVRQGLLFPARPDELIASEDLP